MESVVVGGLKGSDALSLLLIALVAAAASFGVFMTCFWWFRREQRRMQKKIFQAISHVARDPEELFLSGRETAGYGELIAQFKVNRGKQVVSLMEAEGKRFIHVNNGELSPVERAKMVRYLKSEGFMS